MFLPMATFNRRIARCLVELLGIWPKLQEMGIVDVTAYDSSNFEDRFHNLAVPFNFSWEKGCVLAEM